MFASTLTNRLLGYIHANELNSASKCSWDLKLIVSTLKLTSARFCPGQQMLSQTICDVVWGLHGPYPIGSLDVATLFQRLRELISIDR